MAVSVISTIVGGAQSTGLFDSVFSGRNKAQESREKKRAALQSVGFTWRKTSGVPAGQEWNIDNWGTLALDNIARAFDQYGQVVVNLHNERMLSDPIASNYNRLEQIIKENQPVTSNPGGTRAITDRYGITSGGGQVGSSALVYGLIGLVVLTIIGVFWR